jgi:hypothetical protein
MTEHERLTTIQRELKAPKGQFNAFGKYKYRSCEDILEAVKPLLNGVPLTISDELVMIGDRYYVKATVNFGDTVKVTAFAREEADKKGMDSSQITGAASSYARKYALNGLFLIDDNRDSDTTNTHGKEEAKVYKLTANLASSPAVDGMGEPLTDIPEPEIPPAEQPTTFLEAGTSLHKTIEQKIKDYQINRDQFKAWLMEVKKIGLRDERPSLLTMTITDASKLLDKWNTAMTSYQKWLKKQSGDTSA